MEYKKEEIRWQISVPIFKNTVILKQLSLAIGIPFGLLFIVIGIISGFSIYTLYAFALITGVLILTWLLLIVLWGGKYKAEFILDHKGALCRTQTKQAKKNWITNSLTIVIGFLTGKAAVSGAGLLSQSHQASFLKWSRVRKVRYKPKSNTILLWGPLTEHIGIFCTRENYSQVEKAIMDFTKHLNN